MNREIYHSGFLTKSPPPKKFLKASWRRRFFTLIQGELPGQFFLEYYTDETLKKIKGRIDLDDCDQVDAGLRLDRQKHKYQHMFDIKTSHRIYYLAADTEEDMRGWVTCICEVCGLQELAKNNDASVPSTPVSQTKAVASVNNNMATASLNNRQTVTGTISKSTVYNKNYMNYANISNLTESTIVADDSFTSESLTDEKSTYQNHNNNNNTSNNNKNNNMLESQSSHIFEEVHTQLNYTNLPAISQAAKSRHATIDRSQSFDNRGKVAACEKGPLVTAASEAHARSQSFNGPAPSRRIPENLKLNHSAQVDGEIAEPSPALSTSSGPYIPISECFSGSPVIFSEDPKTPLNSLDPRFYDTPRSHINIGLNLTNDQYSPKRNNVPSNNSPPQHSAHPLTIQRSASPTDSDNIFPSDDDEWSNPVPPQDTLDRVTRPSDSSIDNDQIDWKYVQRFSKKEPLMLPLCAGGLPPRPPKKKLVLENETIKETQASDTENPSPVIGPLDKSCSVDDATTYDLPRSHQKYFDSDTASISSHDMTATSTPNFHNSRGGRPYKHNYTNAAPGSGNVFRYDFDDQAPPSVNRNLKPKPSMHSKPNSRDVTASVKMAPNINRSKKPSQNLPPITHGKLDHGFIVDSIGSLRRPPDHSAIPNKLTPEATRLQYLDLDHSPSQTSPPGTVPPSKHKASVGSATSSVQNLNTSAVNMHTVGDGSQANYIKVDFEKTRAFKEIREYAEKRVQQDGSH